MKNLNLAIPVLFLSLLLPGCDRMKEKTQLPVQRNYSDLVALFKEWRAFETPPLRDGAPDYTSETFKKRWPEFKKLQAKLLSLDVSGWPVEQQADWYVVWAEMNGYDFNYHILKPWVRDPAFYKSLWDGRSDVPAHEGPTHHMITDIWKYKFPLNPEQKALLLKDLLVIPPLNTQAKINLTGNAKDLWIAGTIVIRSQSEDLGRILNRPGVKDDPELVSAIQAAITSTNDLATWLEDRAKSKTGPSGIGKENYTWYLQNVHLVPLTWEDEVMILKNELARAWASLKLEEHRNRKLPELIDAQSPEDFRKMAERSVKSMMTFLEKDDIMSVKDYFEPIFRRHSGGFIPKERRDFFWIAGSYDPRPLYSHSYHWIELAKMDNEPLENEIRKGPLLYNIFDSRSEGLATGVEEMFMQAGLYDDIPRAREIVYIMVALRAARGLGSLYAQANEMTMEEAGKIHQEYTPRGWMKTSKELMMFEQHLYLRQPGYGSSYITGKYLLENAMAEFARMKESMKQPFHIKDFFDELNAIGNIPVSLVQWQMTGIKPNLKGPSMNSLKK